MFAVLEGHIEVVPLLLDADAAIDHQNHVCQMIMQFPLNTYYK